MFLLYSVLFSMVMQADSINLISWNVYFDDATGAQRYPKILDHIVKQKADLACLQEVTGKFITRLENDKRFARYHIIKGRLDSGYTNIILSRIPVTGNGVLQLPTRMGRYAVYATIGSGKAAFTLVNLHLDSMPEDTSLRIQQMKVVQTRLQTTRRAVLCGDFNFGDGEPESGALGKQYIDTGLANKIATYNVRLNPWARRTRFKNENSRRLDRIFVKGELGFKRYRLYKLNVSDHSPVSIIIDMGK